jgi:SulP family sulfate permease
VSEGLLHVLQDKQIPEYAAVFRIHGPFLFGATEKLNEVRRQIAVLPEIVILRLRNMTALDSTGLQTIERLADEIRESGRFLVLCGAREQPARLMRQSEFELHVGRENICPHISAALERADALHQAVAHRSGAREVAAEV